MHKYQTTIHWSDKDGVFVADIPGLAGYMANENSDEAALAQAQAAIGYWREAAEEIGRPIPPPAGELVAPNN